MTDGKLQYNKFGVFSTDSVQISSGKFFKPTANTCFPMLVSQELKLQGMVFFVAGYETTSTLLTNTAYLLAKHPDKQQKLLDEIRTSIRDKAICFVEVLVKFLIT